MLLVVLLINPTLLLVVVERCWLYCSFLVVICICDESNVVFGCSSLVVLTINQTLSLDVVKRC
jgi:hypothetical protein